MFWVLEAIFRLNMKESVCVCVCVCVYFSAVKWTRLGITVKLLYQSLNKHYII